MSMRFLFTWIVVTLCLAGNTAAQTVNQVTILPSNPTPGDTIRVISDFSYQGNCSFGMVGIYMDVVNDTIRIFPTYCGYGDTTPCNSIDTFEIPPLPANTYTIIIEYHQGSVCPFSGFDITLLQTDTTVTVNATGIQTTPVTQPSVQVWPNPAGEYIMLNGENLTASHRLYITNTLGQVVFRQQVIQMPMQVPVSGWGGKGVYLLYVSDDEGNFSGIQKIFVQ